MNAKGSRGLPLTSFQWLTAHHEAKKDERKKMVSIHQIRKGDRVLDIACGPGFWTDLLLEQVSPSGTIIGLDIDTSLIAIAKDTYADLISLGYIDFHVGDMRDLPYENDSFDVVICGNAYNYLAEEELPHVVKEHLRVLRPGGRLSVRAFDNTMSLFHPVPSTVLLGIMHGVAESLEDETNFDNYLGRKLHGLFVNLALGPIETQTFVTQKVQPLCSGGIEYIRMKALWYAEKAKGYCSEHNLETWYSLFDPNSSLNILSRPDFYFSTTEMISSVIKSKKH